MKQLLAYLKTIGTPSIYRKGASIYFQGEVPRHAVVILDGVVKSYTISPEGDETIITLYGRGSVLPTAWVNSQSTTALFNYDAVNDVRVVKLEKSSLMNAVNANPAHLREYLEYMGASQAALMLRITGLAQSRAIEKICYTLYFLALHYGINKGDDRYEIDLRLTQGMLASLIGQTRESTAKNLKILKDANVVDYDSSTYVVNRPKLEAYLGEDSFRNLIAGS